MTKLLEFLAVLFAVIIIALVSIVALTDINQYKGQITQAVENATGRQLDIAGDIELSWSLIPTISIEDVTFSNADWGSEPQMLRVQNFELQIALKPLLSGDVEIKKLILTKPVILVETNEQGLSNWQLSSGENEHPEEENSSSDMASVYLNEVVIKDAELTYKDGLTGQQQQLILSTFAIEAASADSAIDVMVDAVYNTVDISIKGNIGAINQLTANQPYPVDVAVSLPDISVAIQGMINQPLEGKGMSLAVNAKANDLTAISLLTQNELPEYGDISLATQFESTDNRYTFNQLALMVGKSDLSGDITLSLNGDRPDIKAKLVSTKLNVNQFLPEAATDKALDMVDPEAVSMEDEPQVKSVALIPTDLIPFELIATSLRTVDADISLNATEITLEQDVISDTQLHAVLNDGHLKVAPFTSLINGGKVALELDLDATAEQVAVALKLDVDSLAKLSSLAGQALPDLSPVKLYADISADKTHYSIANLDVVAGESNLMGNAKVLLDADKPTVIADLTSTKLDVLKLVPVNQDVETQSESVISETKTETNSVLIPANLIPIDDIKQALSMLNAHIKIKADDVILQQGQLTNTVIELKLQDGLLNISPVSTKLDGNAFSGNIELIPEPEKISLVLESHLDSLIKLSSIAGVELPDLAPIKLSGKFTATKDSYELNNLALVAGENDLSGNIKADLTGERPSITGDLLSNNVDLTPFSTGNKEAVATETQTKAKKTARLFSTEPLDLAILKSVDATLSVAAKKIKSDSISLANTVVTIALKKGDLKVNPISFLTAGGQLSGRLTVDASTKNIKLDTDLTMSGFEPNKLAALKQKLTGGKTDVVLKVNGSGESVSQLMSGLNGVFSVNVGDAQITDSIAGALGADVVKELVNMVNPFAKKKQGTDLKCAVVKFDIKDGIATTKKGIAISTAQMNIIGSGIVDLKTEKINIGIKPEPREGLGVNAAKFASMVRVAGTLSSPKPVADITGTLSTGYSLTQAVATGGLSLLAEGLFSRLTADANPCATALGLTSNEVDPEPASETGVQPEVVIP
jgi:uncharacterized protein involved in outer membrane biogenesis